MCSSSILLVTLSGITLSGFGLGIAPNRCLGEEKDEVKQLKDELRSLQAEVRKLREECKALRQEVLALKKRVDDEADGYIGIEVRKEDRSLRVTHVAKGSPAEKAGISKGVVVVAVIVEGVRRNISTVQEFRQAVGNLKPADQIEIRYLDDPETAKEVKGAKIKLGKRP